MLKYETQMGKDLFSLLRDEGYFSYGSIIPITLIHRQLGIQVPEMGTKTMFDNLVLVELAAIGYVRDQLLNHGMYLKKAGQDYRILLASQNAEQVRNLMSGADRKLHRALKLSKNSSDRKAEQDTVEARLHMKRESVRENMRQAQSMT